MTDFVGLLRATADALQMDPVDLATIISYETAGTFDPLKAGPRTQWGQHKGLIQFGEPQAKRYGVDWGDPLGSQLGENGAIARYFRDNGWKPGMGILDAYSIVNAGAPGRYNASDANNGGAPGTVRDKVLEQFGPHREKAMALFGGEPLTFGGVPKMNTIRPAEELTFNLPDIPVSKPEAPSWQDMLMASQQYMAAPPPQIMPPAVAQIAPARRENPYPDFLRSLLNA